MRSTIQVSSRLRQRLAKRKRHPGQSYEEVIVDALTAADGARRTLAARLGDAPPGVAEALTRVAASLRTLYEDRLARLVLFGSVARGDAHLSSDVDILLVLRGDVDRARELTRIVEITYDLLLERGVHLSVLPMAERDYLTLATPLLVNVRREGIPL